MRGKRKKERLQRLAIPVMDASVTFDGYLDNNDNLVSLKTIQDVCEQGCVKGGNFVWLNFYLLSCTHHITLNY